MSVLHCYFFLINCFYLLFCLQGLFISYNKLQKQTSMVAFLPSAHKHASSIWLEGRLCDIDHWSSLCWCQPTATHVNLGQTCIFTCDDTCMLLVDMCMYFDSVTNDALHCMLWFCCVSCALHLIESQVSCNLHVLHVHARMWSIE